MTIEALIPFLLSLLTNEKLSDGLLRLLKNIVDGINYIREHGQGTADPERREKLLARIDEAARAVEDLREARASDDATEVPLSEDEAKSVAAAYEVLRAQLALLPK